MTDTYIDPSTGQIFVYDDAAHGWHTIAGPDGGDLSGKYPGTHVDAVGSPSYGPLDPEAEIRER